MTVVFLTFGMLLSKFISCYCCINVSIFTQSSRNDFKCFDIYSKNHSFVASHTGRLCTIAMAPLPETTESVFTARCRNVIVSCNERSNSSMNCSAPSRTIIVAVFNREQSVKMLYCYESIRVSSDV
jgi:hypothetical protein